MQTQKRKPRRPPTSEPPSDLAIRRAVRAYSVRAENASKLASRLGVTERKFLALRKRYEPQLGWSLEDWVLTALFHASRQIPGIIAWIDWRNHTVYAPSEIRAVLDRLVARGWAQDLGDGSWRATTSEWS
jgi:hypothetical protein